MHFLATALNPAQRLTFPPRQPAGVHYLFRYPAKFHPPVVAALIDTYSAPGQTVLDPFCGSGSTLVEASLLGRNSIGIDVDPVAALVAEAKTHRYNLRHLSSSADRLQSRLAATHVPWSDYDALMHVDITEHEYNRVVGENATWQPAIPHLFHWFRKYVAFELGQIAMAIDDLDAPSTHKQFLRLIFASIIRSCSNADPVPVSGLEVTSHMRRREREGRRIVPHELLRKALDAGLAAIAEYSGLVDSEVRTRVRLGDATRAQVYMREQVDCIITSPPYAGAVDYYRRHKLEMFWLGMTRSQDDRLALLPQYLGRPTVRADHPMLSNGSPLPSAVLQWVERMRATEPSRARGLQHYALGMRGWLRACARLVKADAPLVLVLGNSTWRGEIVPTVDIVTELAYPLFRVTDTRWYPLRNRYMSYARRNGADIAVEHVLVLTRAC